MTQTHPAQTSLLREAGLPYFFIAFVARLPFAMMVVGVLTIVVSVRGSLSLGGLTSAAVGIGTALFGPLLGAAADRFGQRAVLVLLAIANGTMLLVFAFVVYSAAADGLVLLAAFGIGATAPQVAPMSRSRLVTIIRDRMPESVRARTISGTMAYESAADETVFVFGPFYRRRARLVDCAMGAASRSSRPHRAFSSVPSRCIRAVDTCPKNATRTGALRRR
ncbi:hypothetical protein [Microbacterium sp. CH12i]|uniref:hypothetical protein n=1 Tax=Microbacterium sp. CH12i TaxID=1479651 RepID=UPI000A63C64D